MEWQELVDLFDGMVLHSGEYIGWPFAGIDLFLTENDKESRLITGRGFMAAGKQMVLMAQRTNLRPGLVVVDFKLTVFEVVAGTLPMKASHIWYQTKP